MSLTWRITREHRGVPGWPGNERDWWLVRNPHGGVQSFNRTEDQAKADLAARRADWFCFCKDQACKNAPVEEAR